MRPTPDNVADFFLWFAREHGDCLTNLKLQKLLYYAQAWHLALYGRPLFEGHFEAWVHGPVNRRIYGRFKKYRFAPISEDVSKPDFEPSVERHLVKCFSVFGKFSAWDLERMTHAEMPWIKARGGLLPEEDGTGRIAESDMRKFYSSLQRRGKKAN